MTTFINSFGMEVGLYGIEHDLLTTTKRKGGS